jgi:tripartite ATP-independent transporter DctM subunit
VILVLYGIMTGQDIGLLFAAGLLPGLLGVICYLGAIAVITRRNPAAGPPAPRADRETRLSALKGVWGVLVLFVLVMGGIYAGVFTPTEAAGIGASGAFLLFLLRRGWDQASLAAALAESVRTAAMLFFVLIGALIFMNFVNVAGLPTALSDWVGGLALPPLAVIAVILLVYLALGCVLESLSMILLTVPVFFPLIPGLGYDLIWFGVLVVIVTEISLITPPIGLNVFVLRSVLPDMPVATIFRGVTAFWCADIVRLAVVVLVPAIALALPRLIS